MTCGREGVSSAEAWGKGIIGRSEEKCNDLGWGVSLAGSSLRNGKWRVSQAGAVRLSLVPGLKGLGKPLGVSVEESQHTASVLKWSSGSRWRMN